jgi:hypothetical protein
LILWLLFVCLLLVVFWIYPSWHHRQNRRLESRMLTEVDHAAILTAGRKLIQEKRKGCWPAEQYLPLYDPEANALPQSLLKLEPVRVWITEDYVEIKMGDTQGMLVMAEDSRFPPNGQEYRKVIDGLWCYDEAKSK